MGADCSPSFSKSVAVVCKLKFDSDSLGKFLLYPPVALVYHLPKYQLAVKITREAEDVELDFEYRTSYVVTTRSSHQTINSVVVNQVDDNGVMFGVDMLSKASFNQIKKFSINLKSSPLTAGDNILNYLCDFNTVGMCSNYSFQLCDTLMFREMNLYKDAMFTDVELNVSGRIFKGHKAIICARSPVFATMFNTTSSSCAEINDISHDVFQHLYIFLYTGFLTPNFYTCKELEYCAEKYQIKTLTALFRELACTNSTALKRRISDCEDHFAWEKGTYAEEPHTRNTTYFHQFSWDYVYGERGEFEFKGVDMEVFLREGDSLSFYCWNPCRIGLRIDRVCYQVRNEGNIWKSMEKCLCNSANSKNLAVLTGFPHFTAKENLPRSCCLDFRVFFVAYDESYSFCQIDYLRGIQLLKAAENRQHTDVEFVVGHKTFPAHQVIVAARSPYFARVFHLKNFDVGKYHVEDCNPVVFEQLLFFMYTGFLQVPADNEYLLQAAEEFEISTLKTLCRAALESVQEDSLLYLSTLFE